MTGVSYMIPFVAAGGLLIALELPVRRLRDRRPVGDIVVNNTLFNLPDPAPRPRPRAVRTRLLRLRRRHLLRHRQDGVQFLVPALAGYIAYAIADRPGIAPGFVMGGLAVDLGRLRGSRQTRLPRRHHRRRPRRLVAHWISRWKVPLGRGLMPVLVIPLLRPRSSAVADDRRLGKPLGWLMDQLNDGLNHMSGLSAASCSASSSA
jgi:PTS system fructose-specific IIC component